MPIWWRSRKDRDFDEELQTHFEIEVQQRMERGATREQAEVEVRQAFGNTTLVKEVTREMWGWMWLERLWMDVRYAMRQLWKSPGFTLTIVLTLGLGIGVNTAVFSVVDTVLLRPLPYPESNRLVWVAEQFPSNKEYLLSVDYVEWQHENHVFDNFAAFPVSLASPMVMRDGSDLTQIQIAKVTSNFFATLKSLPLLGRSFTSEEGRAGGPNAIILSHQLWQRQFGGQRSVLQRTITLDGNAYTIVGVMPSGFSSPVATQIDAFVSLQTNPAATRQNGPMFTWGSIARLKPGVTLEQARAELAVLFAASRAKAPGFYRSDIKLRVIPFQEYLVEHTRLTLLVLLGAVACLLLITCANVANLLLGRWAARNRELAVRAAIGATRARLIRQLFTESLLLALAGGLAGLLIVYAALGFFTRWAADYIPRANEITVDTRVLLIALGVSLFTALFFGIAPAFKIGWGIQAGLQTGARLGMAAGYGKFRSILVIGEIGLSLVLLIASGLLFRTVWNLQNHGLGFQPESVLTVNLPLKGTRLEKGNVAAFAEELQNRVLRIPGTMFVSLANGAPPHDANRSSSFSRNDRPLPGPFNWDDPLLVAWTGPDYFRALSVPLLKGRFFTEKEPEPVAIINQTTANTYFPGEEPLGKGIGGVGPGKWKTIIGIVADMKNNGLDKPPLPEMYLPYEPNQVSLNLIVRSTADMKALTPALRAEIRNMDSQVLPEFRTLNQEITKLTVKPQINSVLVGSFAAFAFLLALVGIYGVIAFSVSQRTQEIGIRIALGARPGRVLLVILSEASLLLFAGITLGLLTALGLTRFLKSLLYEVTATDGFTYALVVIGLGSAALLASLIPARRAASVDPMVALRHE